ncbi:tyrosine-type recombinase/integrase [Spiribacter pallidus]|uniref:tyrosine-type recombinase/integrase n=1 Tax=Spiribacter pallidus TaxID=1987936 RepID=UPI00349F1CE4
MVHLQSTNLLRCPLPVGKITTSHSGRRSYLTKLADKGVGVFVLAQLAGHRHISTTQRYVSVSDTQLRNAAELSG